MACNELHFNDPIFKVVIQTRKIDFNGVYIFVGNKKYLELTTTDKNKINKILKKIQDEKKITNNELQELYEVYDKDDIKSWINLNKKTEYINPISYIKFVTTDMIYLDDTYSVVQKKIFTYCSNDKQNFYLKPNNQEVWVKDKNIFALIGNTLELPKDKSVHQEITIIEPSITQKTKIKPDKNYYDKDRGSILRDDLEFKNNNKTLLYNLLKDHNICCYTDVTEKYELFVNDLYTEIQFVESKMKDFRESQEIINGYFKKYWPLGKIPDFSLSNSKSKSSKSSPIKLKTLYNTLKGEYKNVSKSIKNTEKVIDLVNLNQLKIKDFPKCEVYKFNINTDKLYQSDDKLLDEYVDIFKIISYFRQNLSEDIPFIKYMVNNKIYFSVYKDAVEKKIVTKEQLKKWIFGVGSTSLLVGDSQSTKTSKQLEEEKRLYGKAISKMVSKLQVKKYIYTTLDGIKKYSTIVFYDSGQINVFFTYKDGENKNMNDIITHINSLAPYIEKINKINFQLDKSLPTRKYVIPKMKISDGMIYLNRGLNISTLGLNINYSVGNSSKKSSKGKSSVSTSLDYDKLEKYILQFYPYISKHVKTVIEEKKGDDIIFFKYNRVNNFDSLFDIYQDIDVKARQDIPQEKIIEYIKDKYTLTDKKATRIVMTWKKRQLLLRVKRINTSGDGINIRITKSSEDPSKNIIKITNIKNMMEFTKVYYFIITVINMFNDNVKIIPVTSDIIADILENEDEFEVLKDVYDSNSNLIQKTEEELSDYDIDFEGLSNIDVDLDNDFDELNTDNRPIAFKKNETDDIKTNIAESIGDEKLSSKKSLLGYDDSYIYKTDRLECSKKCGDCETDKPIYEKDTCKDACNDRRYYIRRLQRFDKDLFVFKGKGKKKFNYARACQSAPEKRQPIVMKKDPKEDKRIKPEAYSNSVIKYGSSSDNQNYYICPQAWCPICEIPLVLSQVKNLREKVLDNKDVCYTGKCPYGDHDVMIKSQYKNLKSPEDLRKPEYSFDKKYVGFSRTQNPDGLCLPCCFSVPQTTKSIYKKCMGEEVEDTSDGKSIDYILGRTTIPLPFVNRYSFLPKDLYNIFVTPFEVTTGIIKKNQYNFFKKGISNDISHSFMIAVADALKSEYGMGSKSKSKSKTFLLGFTDIYKTTKQKQITSEDIIDVINKNLTDKIFDTLKNGLIKVIFKTKTNFINYLKSPSSLNNNTINPNDININEKFLWDLLSRPGMLTKNGVNIFIFSRNSIICPVGENITTFYDIKKRPSVFIVKDNSYYEPIYLMTGLRKKIYIKSLFQSSDSNNNTNITNMISVSSDDIKKELLTNINKTINNLITKVYDIMKIQCREYYELNLGKIVKNNEDKLDVKYLKTDFTKEKTLQYTLKTLDELINDKKLSDTYSPKQLVLDNFNKINAIVLKNKLYIPVKPTGQKQLINKKLETISVKQVKPLSYKKTLQLLSKLVKIKEIPTIPISKITKDNIYNYKVSTKNKVSESETVTEIDIIGLVLKTGRIIPVKSRTIFRANDIITSNSTNISNKSNKISDVDKKLLEAIGRFDFEEETYQRLRYELGYVLNKSEYKKQLQKIRDITEEYALCKDKRVELYKILLPIIRDFVYNKKDLDISEYQRDNIRFHLDTITSKDKCNKNPHLVYHNGKCKIYVSDINYYDSRKNNLDYYISIIIEELIRNKNKRYEILNNNISDIVDRTKVVAFKDEILLNTDKLLDKIDKIYRKKNKYYDQYIKYPDTSQPEYTNIDLKRYLLSQENINRQKTEYPDIKVSIMDINKNKNKNAQLKEEKLNRSNIDLVINYKELPQEIIPFLNDSYEILETNRVYNSLFTSIMLIENSKSNLGKKTTLNIKEQFLHYIKDITLKDIELILTVRKDVNISEMKLSGDWRDILNLYKDMYSNEYKNINNFKQLTNHIMSNFYNPKILDIMLLSMAYNINFIIFMNDELIKDRDSYISQTSLIRKPTKKLPFLLIAPHCCEDYSLVYGDIKKCPNEDAKKFNLIIFKQKYSFKLDELPKKMVKSLEKYDKFDKEELMNASNANINTNANTNINNENYVIEENNQNNIEESEDEDNDDEKAYNKDQNEQIENELNNENIIRKNKRKRVRIKIKPLKVSQKNGKQRPRNNKNK